MPSGENATVLTRSPLSDSVARERLVARSHSCVPAAGSRLPVASVFPSGENATDQLLYECVDKAGNGRMVRISQRPTVPSLLPAARVRPSDENATQVSVPGGENSATTCGRAPGEGISHNLSSPGDLPRSR